MLFGRAKKPTLTPPAGLGREDIATESSICTGETLMGFRDPKTGRLLQAVVVRTPQDREKFYLDYGFVPKK